MPQRGELQVEDVLDPSAERLPVWPMIIGVVASAIVLEFICSWLPRGGSSRFGVVLLAVSLLFVAVLVSGSVVRAIYTRLRPGMRRVSTPVIRAACITALWVPAWVLFVQTWSLLMIAAAVLCLACLGVFLKLCDLEPALVKPDGPVHEPGTPFLFEARPLARVLLPSLALAVLFNATIALAAMHWFVTASIAAGVFAGIVGWRAVMRSSAAATREVLSSARQSALATTAFLFTIVALIPFLHVRPLMPPFPGLFAQTVPKNSSASTNQVTANDGYPGIILLPLKEQQKKIIAPVKREFVPHFGVKIAEPLEIPFDGQYWYFKWPDKRPRPSAHVVRASAAKVQIRSSDRYALLMEAHQKLGQQLDLGCCSAMNLVVENADQLEGAISLELWVKKLPAGKAITKPKFNAVEPEQAPHYLGTVVIPSSQLPIAARPNASGKIEEETLRFPIPAAMDGIQFDEITVVVRPAPMRAKMGAKVAIKKFVLEP